MKKRPCKVYRRWFRPNPRVGDAQMTCGHRSAKENGIEKNVLNGTGKTANISRRFI